MNKIDLILQINHIDEVIKAVQDFYDGDEYPIAATRYTIREILEFLEWNEMSFDSFIDIYNLIPVTM